MLMKERTYLVPLIVLPQQLTLSSYLRRRVKAAESGLALPGCRLGAQIERQLASIRPMRKPGIVKSLEHPLSRLAQSRMDGIKESRRGDGSRSRDEKSSYGQYRLTLLQAIDANDFPCFIAVLCQIASAARGTETVLRSSAVFTAADRFGGRWRYPDATRITDALAALCRYLKESDQSALVKAATAHVTLASLHPFDDGNGRTARIVFNALLDSVKPPGTYIPLKELMELAERGYTIRSRLFYQRGEWAPIIEFFCNVAEAYTAFGRRVLSVPNAA